MNTEYLQVYEEWMFEDMIFGKLEDILDFIIFYFKKDNKRTEILCKMITTKNLELPNGIILKSDTESRDVCIKRNGEIIYL